MAYVASMVASMNNDWAAAEGAKLEICGDCSESGKGDGLLGGSEEGTTGSGEDAEHEEEK